MNNNSLSRQLQETFIRLTFGWQWNAPRSWFLLTNPTHCSKHTLIGPPIAHAHFAVDDGVCQGIDKRCHSCEKHHKLARPPICCQGYDVADLKRKPVRTEHHIYGMEGCGGFKEHIFFNFGPRKLYLACSIHLIFVALLLFFPAAQEGWFTHAESKVVVQRGKCNNKVYNRLSHDVVTWDVDRNVSTAYC